MSHLVPRSLFTAAVAVAVLFGPAARAADEPKDILAKAIKAHGGEDALTKYKASQMKAKGKITIAGVGAVDFTQEASFMLPDKFRESVEITVGGQTIKVLTIANGDKITIDANGMAVEATDPIKDSLKHAGHLLHVGRLAPLKDKKYELSLIGEDKVEGKKVVGIRVSAKDQKDVSLYFDKETWLLVKIEARTTEPMTGEEINEERIVTEYTKTKDGLPTAKKLVVKRDGKLYLEAEVTEVTYLEKLDDDVFKK